MHTVRVAFDWISVDEPCKRSSRVDLIPMRFGWNTAGPNLVVDNENWLFVVSVLHGTRAVSVVLWLRLGSTVLTRSLIGYCFIGLVADMQRSEIPPIFGKSKEIWCHWYPRQFFRTDHWQTLSIVGRMKNSIDVIKNIVLADLVGVVMHTEFLESRIGDIVNLSQSRCVIE